MFLKGESSSCAVITNEERRTSSEPDVEEDNAETKTKTKTKTKKKKEKKIPENINQNIEVISCTLKMRGIPFKSTEEDVIQFFKPSTITDIRFPKDKADRPSGYAFVDFESLSDAQEAAKKNGKTLKGRYIELFSETNHKQANRKYGKNGEWLNKVSH